MIRPKDPLPVGEVLFVQRQRLTSTTHRSEAEGEVVAAGEGVGMIRAKDPLPRSKYESGVVEC